MHDEIIWEIRQLGKVRILGNLWTSNSFIDLFICYPVCHSHIKICVLAPAMY